MCPTPRPQTPIASSFEIARMSLADRIAARVIEQYDSLKPRGKPQGREWTVLAGIVAQDTRVS